MTGGVSARATSREIRESLGYPVIDVDGHLQEISPFFRDDCLEYAREVGGTALVERIEKSPLTYDENLLGRWFRMSEDERRDEWAPCMAWWGVPTEARHRAVAYLPAYLYELMDELGIDFSVLYPSLGLTLPAISDPDIRHVACRVYNTTNAGLYRDYADRMTPVAMIPMSTPEEAIG